MLPSDTWVAACSRPSFPVCEASCSDRSFPGCASAPPASCLPLRSVPRPCSAASSCVYTCQPGIESRAPHKGGSGAWCPLGMRLEPLRRSLVTCPASANPDWPAAAQSQAILGRFSGHSFDRRQEFLVPLTSSAQKCRLWWLWLVVHLRDKGTGQPAHSW